MQQIMKTRTSGLAAMQYNESIRKKAQDVTFRRVVINADTILGKDYKVLIGTGKYFTMAFIGQRGWATCTCAGFYYKRRCKHVYALWQQHHTTTVQNKTH